MFNQPEILREFQGDEQGKHGDPSDLKLIPRKRSKSDFSPLIHRE